MFGPEDIGRIVTYVPDHGPEERGRIRSYDNVKRIAFIVYRPEDEMWVYKTAQSTDYDHIKELREENKK